MSKIFHLDKIEMNPVSPILTAEQRKEKIKNFFFDLIPFVELLQKDEEINVNCLTKLEELQEYTNKQFLQHNDIGKYVGEIASYLCTAFQSSLKSQLSSYWKCWVHIIVNCAHKYVDLRKKTNEYISHMQEVDSMYQELYDQHPENDDIALYATFYMHIVIVEKIEYALQQDLRKSSADVAHFDIEHMFSFGNKVKKNTAASGYVTRGRAIRDALAHKKFKICNQDEQKYIVFENKDHGYDFQEQLTVDEFLRYIHGNNMLYRIMYILQSLLLLSSLLHESLDLDR